ncbi:hypothetical protein SANTM175S_03779 [Streptomyces antimycoticus]
MLGELVDTAGLDAEYWYRNLRQTVELEATTRTLLNDGHTVFIEASPHPVLTLPVQQTVEAAGAQAVVVGTLRRDEGGLERFLTSAAEVFVRGVAVDWTALLEGRGARRVELPTYAFRRQRYWLEVSAAELRATADGLAADAVDARFWEAVEREDLEALVRTLEVEDEEQQSSLTALLPALSSWRRQRREQNTVDSWRYKVVWKPLAAATEAALSGTWVVVLPASHADDALVTATVNGLETSGADIVRVVLEEKGNDRWSVGAERLRGALDEAGVEPSGVAGSRCSGWTSRGMRRSVWCRPGWRRWWRGPGAGRRRCGGSAVVWHPGCGVGGALRPAGEPGAGDGLGPRADRGGRVPPALGRRGRSARDHGRPCGGPAGRSAGGHGGRGPGRGARLRRVRQAHGAGLGG